MKSDAPRSVGILLATVVLIVSLAPASVRAQEKTAIGTEVVLKPGASVKVGTKVVDPGKSHRIYSVERINGALRQARLFVGDEARIVPVAIDYLTNPDSPWAL